MTSAEIEVLISCCGFVMSMLGSVLIVGLTLGTFRATVTGELRHISERLARIEGMFTLTPVDRSSNASMPDSHGPRS